MKDEADTPLKISTTHAVGTGADRSRRCGKSSGKGDADKARYWQRQFKMDLGDPARLKSLGELG